LVRWPGVVPEGRVVDEWATSLNVLPMLAAWCGLDKPRLPLDGADMGGMLTGGPTPEEHIQIYFTPFDANKQVHCIRRGNWKLRVAQNDGQIYINDQPYAKKNYMLARPELYHLREDPMESYDVAGQNPEVVKELMVELEERIASFPPEIVAAYEKLKEDKASRTTPPGATPRVVTGPLPDWAWEPEDRKG
jgi:arylsulfatase